MGELVAYFANCLAFAKLFGRNQTHRNESAKFSGGIGLSCFSEKHGQFYVCRTVPTSTLPCGVRTSVWAHSCNTNTSPVSVSQHRYHQSSSLLTGPLAER